MMNLEERVRELLEMGSKRNQPPGSVEKFLSVWNEFKRDFDEAYPKPEEPLDWLKEE
jgi:hypothetical protein